MDWTNPHNLERRNTMAREQMKKPVTFREKIGEILFDFNTLSREKWCKKYDNRNAPDVVLATVIEALPGARTAGERRYKAEAIKKLKGGL